MGEKAEDVQVEGKERGGEKRRTRRRDAVEEVKRENEEEINKE